jgi:hypothetical protein
LTEAVRGEPKTREGRCPYCHDGFAEAAPDAPDPRVTCALCATPHHAECFVENEGCSVMGCGAKEAQTGPDAAPLAVGLIAAALERGDLDVVVDERSRRARTLGSVILLGGVSLMSLLLVLVLFGGAAATGAGVVLAALAGAFWLFGRAFAARPLVVTPDASPASDDPRRHWSEVFVAPNPYDAIRREIDDRAPPGEPDAVRPPPVSGPAPTRCRACGGDLHAPDGEENDLRFCYHCGASLA